MADTRSSDLGDDRRIDNIEEDPFAELSRLIDEPWGAHPISGPSEPSRDEKDHASAEPASDPFDGDSHDLLGVLDAELSATFLDEDGSGSTPHPAMQSSTAFDASAPAGPDDTRRPGAESSIAAVSVDAALGSNLEAALRGLSAPVNPRGIAIHESEAFVPARREAPPAPEAADKPVDDFDELIASELAAMKPVGRPIDQSLIAKGRVPDTGETVPAKPVPAAQPEAATLVVASQEPSEQPRAGSPSPASAPARPAAGRLDVRSRGVRLAASVLAIAIVGAAGAYWVSDEGGGGDLLIVRADTNPVKVAPKDPGGRAIPNQNQAVYERVQSADADIVPAQRTLVTAAEEPVDLPGVDLNPISSARAAEPMRIANASNDASPIAVLTPRRVRTMTVRPDGTLVVPDPKAAVGDMGGNGAALIEAASRSAAAGVVQAVARLDEGVAGQPSPGVPVPGARPDIKTEGSVRIAALAAPDSARERTSPAAAVETVGSIASETSSEAKTVVPPVAAEKYFVQISSQPSETAAETTSRTLGERYAEVIGQRDLVIQSADIPGKGTYYRVRIATGSKAEASTLCTALKSAGGSCFVAR